MNSQGLLLCFAVALVGCGAPEIEDADLSESDFVLSEASGNGCLPCPTQSCASPGTCLSRKVLTGNCSCRSGAYCSIAVGSMAVTPDSYGTTTYTAWSGGGDVKACTRQQIRHSYKTALVYKNCEKGVIVQTVYSGQRVRKSRGSVAGTFGNNGTCGLFETWGPWSSWQNE